MAETWDRVKEVFTSALEKSPSERADFLRQACGSDDSLRAEVESLLSCYSHADSCLEDSPAVNLFSTLSSVMAGKRLGPYRIIRESGHGGMAVVYLAERADQQYQKRVAIKMVQPGINSEEILRRFRHERQTLASLDHPNIVKLLDGGSTEEGLPYLVMDYVEGLPIDEYCDSRTLSVTQRLELFRIVCAAVQYAHENQVIHRDLKPSNILVTAEGVPRLLDFGIAKLLNPERFAQTTLVTQAGLHAMTPEFASPEQVRGDTVKRASDIFSLGVLLYGLLTGHSPYHDHAKRDSLLEIQRVICEHEPAKPSTAVGRIEMRTSRDGESSVPISPQAVSCVRGCEPEELRSRLHGDLDAIVLKALRKEPQHRFASAEELAADIGRHLRNEPVMASPASAAYRMRKFVLRHRVGVAAVAGLVTLLFIFVVMQAFQLRRITRERDRANRVTDFMTRMFRVSDPGEARGNSVTAREILDKASKDIDAGLAHDPQVQAQMMEVMGTVYDNLGLFPRAESLLRRAVEIRRRVVGPEHPDTLNAMTALAWNLERQGHYADAEKLQRHALDTQRRVLGTENPDTLRSMNDLTWTLEEEGRHAEAEKLERETLDIRRRLFGPEHPDTLKAMNNLGWTLQKEGRYTDAEKLQRETLEIRRRILGPDHLDTLGAMNNLAVTLRHEGQTAEAEKLQRETIDIDRRVLGREHPGTLRSMNNLALTLTQEQRYSEAEKIQLETIEIRRRVLGPEHPETLSTVGNLAETLAREGRFAEAEKLNRETLEVRRRVLGPEHPDTLETMSDLADTLTHEGRYPEAEKLYRQTHDIQSRVLGPEHPDTAATTYALASVAALKGNPDAALSLLRDAIDHGLSPQDELHIEKDPDLKSLHGDSRFDALISYARQQAAAKKPN